jgi:hypothetical protein
MRKLLSSPNFMYGKLAHREVIHLQLHGIKGRSCDLSQGSLNAKAELVNNHMTEAAPCVNVPGEAGSRK